MSPLMPTSRRRSRLLVLGAAASIAATTFLATVSTSSADSPRRHPTHESPAESTQPATSSTQAPTSGSQPRSAGSQPATTSTEPAAAAAASEQYTADTLPPPEGTQFFEDFQTPEGFFERFETGVFHGSDAVPEVSEWMGDHNVDCAGPDTTRPVHVANHAEMFWWCAPAGPESGHVMTSMVTTAYAHVDFAPNQAFTDVTRVCWDQNQTEMGGRKWTQVVVVSEATYEANGGDLNYIKPPLQNDVAVQGIRIEDDTFMFEMLRGSTATYVGQGVESFDAAGFTTTDKAQRFRTCVIDLGDGTVQIELERPDGVEVRVQQGSFPRGDVRVIFQDVTYDSPKGDGASPSLATWHWDNIEIA